MVLCQDTRYVLLDEPLNSLDMKHAVAMMGTLRRAADELGKTVVLVLPDINFASSYADRIVAMRQGRIAHQGTPAELIRAEVLSPLYELPIDGHRRPESAGPTGSRQRADSVLATRLPWRAARCRRSSRTAHTHKGMAPSASRLPTQPVDVQP
ncbi:hypothetical protein G6F59_015142 [Rhizopus arrhizus]|nr:hypothetical protein G6F59_015142 [Rhizopus arrhizus]